MVEFMWTVVLGNVFMFAMVLLVIGFMFVLRVMLNVWFDTDFMKRIAAWFKATDEKLKKKKKPEENVMYIIEEEEDENQTVQ